MISRVADPAGSPQGYGPSTFEENRIRPNTFVHFLIQVKIFMDLLYFPKKNVISLYPLPRFSVIEIRILLFNHVYV